MKNQTKKLSLSPDGQILGVAQGLADHFKVDPFIIRFLFLLATVYGTFGLTLYIILYICMPERHDVEEEK